MFFFRRSKKISKKRTKGFFIYIHIFQIQSNSENLVAGSIETVKALTKTDMHNYHQTYYAPENLHTVIIADDSISIESIMDEVVKSFKPSYAHNQKITPKKEELKLVHIMHHYNKEKIKCDGLPLFEERGTAFSFVCLFLYAFKRVKF